MISVIMAVYKGDKNIRQQLLSVLSQLGFGDEVIVSDDKPGGITERIVKQVAAEDSRVIWVEGKNKGTTANIVNAVRHCKSFIPPNPSIIHSLPFSTFLSRIGFTI